MGITAKGQPGGLATLDDNGRIPGTQTTQGAAVPDAPALTSSDAAGETPTGEEYDALRADVAALRATVLALQASLRDAGFIASS